MSIPVIILAGGFGTRISEETENKPKPMVLIGDKPILWHVMNVYAVQGFNDFVIATGETRSVRDMCKYVFTKLNLNYEDYITQNEKYLRPEELPYLKGDATKAKTILKWKPEYTFEKLVNEMTNQNAKYAAIREQQRRGLSGE